MPDCGSVGGDGRRDQAGRRDEAEPQRHEAGVDLAAGGDHVAVDVGGRDLREDRLEAGGLARGGEDLADAHVGGAGHRGAAVAPGLLVRPGHHLGGVLVLAGVERVPLALARAGAAGVDGELGVAALDEVRRVRAGQGAAEAAGDHRLVVRRDGHDDRDLGADGGAVRVGREGQVAAQHARRRTSGWRGPWCCWSGCTAPGGASRCWPVPLPSVAGVAVGVAACGRHHRERGRQQGARRWRTWRAVGQAACSDIWVPPLGPAGLCEEQRPGRGPVTGGDPAHTTGELRVGSDVESR